MEPKTPLGQRLRAIRAEFGEDDRDAFAARLGISKSSIAHYERGESAPGAEALAAYRDILGVNVNWLLTGGGSMFDDPSKAPAPSTGVDIVLLERLHDAVHSVFIECKQTPPPRAVTAEAGELYNQLLGMVADIRDKAVVDAVIPVLRERFRERVASAGPGSGKREAS